MAGDAKVNEPEKERRSASNREPSSTFELDALVDRLLDEQRKFIVAKSDGKTDAGWATAEDYLQRYPQLRDAPDRVIDLIYNEFLLATELANADDSTPPDANEYLARFPQYADSLENQFQFFEGFQSGILGEEPDAPDPTRNELSSIVDEQGEPRFELLAKLGEGGFATVYKARDHKLKRFVAIKISKSAIDPGSKQAQRFAREAESAARLSHPAIVSVFEYSNADGRPFIVEQLMEGGSLAEKLNRGRVNTQDAVQWMIALCDSIDYAHQFGVVHRDIKPGNILFDRERRPYVADFGLASISESDLTITQQGDLLGTPAYMSPEQARGGPETGPLSDVYSLGVVLYQLICGRLPFEGRSNAVLQQAIAIEPPAPRSHDSHVPVDLQTICLKAMAKSPSERYVSAREMGDDLRRFQFHEPIKARPIGPVGKAWRFCRRQPALASTLFASFLLILTISVVSFLRIADQRDMYRAERDRANRELYQSLIANAESNIRSKQTGWNQKTLDALGQASEIDIPDKDVSRLRELMIEAIADTSPRFEIEFESPGHESSVEVLAADDQARFLAVARADGSLKLHGRNLNKVLMTLETASKAPMNLLAFDPSGKTLFGLQEGQLFVWDIERTKSDPDNLLLPKRATRFSNVETFAVSGSSLIAIAIRGSGVSIHPIKDGQIAESIATFETFGASVNAMDFTFNSEHIAVALSNSVNGLWTANSGIMVGKQITREPVKQLVAKNLSAVFTDFVSHNCESWQFEGALSTSELWSSPLIRLGNCRHGTIGVTRGGMLVLLSDIGGAAQTRSSSLGEITSLATNENLESIFVGYRDGRVRRWTLQRSELVSNSVGGVVGELGSDRNMIWTPSHRISIDDQNKTSIEVVERKHMHSLHTGQKTGLIVWAHGSDLLTRNPGGITRRRTSAMRSNIERVAVSPNEKYIAAHSADGMLAVWQLPEFTKVAEFIERHPLALELTGSHVLIANSKGTYARSILGKDDIHWLSANPQAFASIAVTHNRVASCGPGNTIEIREPSTWKLIHRLEGHSDSIEQIAFRRSRPTAENSETSGTDDWNVVSLSRDDSLRFWNADGVELRKLPVETGVIGFSVDPKNEFIALKVISRFIRLCDIKSGKTLAYFADCFSSYYQWKHQATFSRDGNKFYFAHDSLIEFDRELLEEGRRTGHQIGQYEVIEPGFSLLDIFGMSLSPNGQWHACGGHDRHVYVRDRHLSAINKVLGGFSGQIWCVEFSPDSKTIAIGSERDGKGELSIWNTTTWQCIRRLPFGTKLVSAISWHPKLPLMAVSNFDGSAALLETEGFEVCQELLGGGAATMHIEFNKSGTYLIAARTSKGIVAWPINSRARFDRNDLVGTPIPISDPGEMVWGVSFMPSEKQIASVAESGKIRIYTFPACEPLVTLNSGKARLRRVAFTEDEKLMVVSAYSASGQIWRLDKLREKLKSLGLDW